jgi:hypothetical protein
MSWQFSFKFPFIGRVKPAIRAKYDAAATTRENQNHWSHADALSADAGLSVRGTNAVTTPIAMGC